MAKTQAQWMAEALAHMKQATWTPERWATAILDGYAGHEYDFTVTHNYKAQVAMWNAAHPAPVPVPPTPSVDPHSQYVVFCAQEPQTALAAPAKYCIAFSADKAYRTANLADIVAQARGKGHRVAGWCDCRPAPDGTPASVGVQFVKDYGLDYFIGQAESAAEFDDAVSAGAKVVVGNITALRNDQVKRLKVDLELIQERYWNEGWATAESALISAYCNGIYAALWNPTIQAYKDSGRWREGDGLYHAAAVQDWASLP